MQAGQNCPQEAYILEEWNMIKIQVRLFPVKLRNKTEQGEGLERDMI